MSSRVSGKRGTLIGLGAALVVGLAVAVAVYLSWADRKPNPGMPERRAALGQWRDYDRVPIEALWTRPPDAWIGDAPDLEASAWAACIEWLRVRFQDDPDVYFDWRSASAGQIDLAFVLDQTAAAALHEFLYDRELPQELTSAREVWRLLHGPNVTRGDLDPRRGDRCG